MQPSVLSQMRVKASMANSAMTRSKQPSPVFLLDASIYIFRNYFSMPDAWVNEQGYSLNAVYGYTLFLLRLLDEYRPQRIAAAFDESLGQCFRNELMPSYKQSRALPDDSLAFQLNACKEVTSRLGIACYASKRYEADDIIATLAKRMRNTRRPIAVISRDKDLAQLIETKHDCLWDIAGDRRWDATAVEDKFGVRPEQLVDYQTMVGDPIDDVPGVPGVGAKTAAKLLQHFGSLESIMQNLSALEAKEWRGGKRIARNLDDSREQMLIVKQLVLLANNIPLAVRASDLSWRPMKRAGLLRYLTKIGLEGRIHQTIKKSTVLID